MTLLEKTTQYLLPKHLQNHPLHQEYERVHGLVNVMLWRSLFLYGMAFLFSINYYPLPALFYEGLSLLIVLPFLKINIGEPAFLVAAFFLYLIYCPAILKSGGICSIHLALLYPFLLVGLFGLPKYGIFYMGGNIVFLIILYICTPARVSAHIWETKPYVLLIHLINILLTGALFWFLQKKKETIMLQNKDIQNHKMNTLNKEISRRTKELNNMHQTIAADFHDETGNILSSIMRQATLLKMKLEEKDLLNSVEHIIANSNQLYISSRHFIWNLNNDSDDPQILFNYLTSSGQLFYNQFDISFSAENTVANTFLRLEPLAAINLIFIFKEAMNNVVKHAGAEQVILRMSYDNDHLYFSLTDDGIWKKSKSKNGHNGLSNMKKRSAQNNFRFKLNHISGTGTRIEIGAPVIGLPQAVETVTV